MEVAVIGGTRFIGPYIVRRLIENGHKVKVYHRGKTMTKLPAGVQHVTVNRNCTGQLSEALARNSPDLVIDLCCYTAEHVEEITATPLDIQHYVACTTTAVYGQIGKSTPNELCAVKPRSEYEVGKVACENQLFLAYIEKAFPFTILRLAHPYGPQDQLIYSTGRESLFLDRMRKGRPIVIPGAGDTRIHPIYVEDAANAFVYVLGRRDCIGKTFNLAGDEILTHDEYFESIARVLGVRLVAEHIPGEWFEDNARLWSSLDRNFNFAAVWHRYESGFDVSALRSVGFRCCTSHDEGVAANVEWLDQNGLIPQSSDSDLENVVIQAWKNR